MCFEDAEVVAFMDIQPVNAGHVLVVPREHYESIEDIPPSLASHLFQVSMQLAPVVKQVAGAEGLNLVVNSGVAAGQDVFHYHVHVIPRRQGDGFDIPLPFPASEMPDRTVLDMNAARIIAAMRDPLKAWKRPERRQGVTDRRASSSQS
jgi:histidine triad (HIT) family protein